MSLKGSIRAEVPNISWLSLKQEWTLSFVDYSDIGCSPCDSLLDMLTANKSRFENNVSPATLSMVDFKAIMIREAIFLVHKAGSLLRSCYRDINDHDQTYAEITAYTASFFLARAITILLGCFLLSKKVNGKHWLINARNNRGKSSVNIMNITQNNVGHIDVWLLFKSLVDKTNDNPFDGEFNSFIGGISPNDFAKTRNIVQYNNCAWIYDDLHYFTEDSKLWIKPFSRQHYVNADPDDPSGHFSVVLSLMLFRAFDLMLEDISHNIPTLLKERQIILENMQYCDDSLKSNSWIQY